MSLANSAQIWSDFCSPLSHCSLPKTPISGLQQSKRANQTHSTIKQQHFTTSINVHFKRNRVSDNASWHFEFVLHTSHTYWLCPGVCPGSRVISSLGLSQIGVNLKVKEFTNQNGEFETNFTCRSFGYQKGSFNPILISWTLGEIDCSATWLAKCYKYKTHLGSINMFD